MELTPDNESGKANEYKGWEKGNGKFIDDHGNEVSNEPSQVWLPWGMGDD